MFLSGEHYNCHPHIVNKDGSGLRKLADRGGYRGVVEVLKHPDFHSESSDVPAWAPDEQIYVPPTYLTGPLLFAIVDGRGETRYAETFAIRTV